MPKNQHKLLIVILLINFSWFHSSSLNCADVNINEPKNKLSNYSTELNISNAELMYSLYSSGNYRCSFKLRVIGNNITAVKSTQCRIIFWNLPINDLEIYIEGISTNYSSFEENSSLTVLFSTENQRFPINVPFIISGKFSGEFKETSLGYFNYTMGVNLGTIVGQQRTEINVAKELSVIEVLSDEQPIFIENTSFGQQFIWEEFEVQSTETGILIQSQYYAYRYLEISVDNWNASIGESIEVIFRNTGKLTLSVVIIKPDWISCNLSFFSLHTNKIITIKFTINALSSIGNEGNISVIIPGNTPIFLPVKVVRSSFFITYDTVLQVISFISVISVLGVAYFRKDEIKRFTMSFMENYSFSRTSNQIQEDLTETLNITQESKLTSIQSRWKSILPENELKVIEILFTKGSMNQKAIAEEMGVSTVTMSRIISRLETKRLVVRERLGMSNMIELIEEKL